MAEVETDLELGQRYRLVRRIAVGGMGSVWEAEDTVLHRRVAVKLLSDSLSADRRFADRFRREAQAAARLSHHNIAGVFDYGEDDGHQFIVMELVQGLPLSDRLADAGRIDPSEAVAAEAPSGESSRAAKAAAEGGRAAGSLARACSQAATTWGGTSAASSLRGGGWRCTCWAATPTGVSPVNGGRPASISYSTTPRE